MNIFKQLTEAVCYMAIVLCVTLFLVSCDKKKNEEPEPNVVAVNIAAIQGVTKPVAETAPVTTITETEQYTGVVTWTPAVSGTFAAETDYTATITLTAKSGYTFNGVEANFFIVDGATTVSNAANSGNVTAKFSVNVEANGITWEITEDGTLIISGTGAMPDYHMASRPYRITSPWYSYREIITAVVINDGITSIGNTAFRELGSLTEVTIPNSITSIGDYAFIYIKSLSEITIPSSVISIGTSAFEGCSLTEVTIPNSVTSIGDYAFLGCNSLTSIDIEENNTVYASENGVLFNKSKTELITYPAGKHDFNYTIPNSVETIGCYAFYLCDNLTDITIPNSVTSIEDNTFLFCSSLTSITIPASVTTIEPFAFARCRDLTSITIPSSVTTFENFVFCDCHSLTEVINESVTPQTISEFVFANLNPYGLCSSACTLRVPKVSIDAYRVAEGWKDFGNIVAIE